MEKKTEIVVMCKECRRLPQLDKEKSNSNWEYTEQKKCPICGGEYDCELVSKEELNIMRKDREKNGKWYNKQSGQV